MGTDCSQPRESTRHARAQGVAQGIESQYRALLEAIPDLIFHLDGEGRFLDFSPAKGQEPAIPPGEFLGRTVSEVLPADIAEKIMRHIEQALLTGGTQVLEYTLPIPLPDGNPRDFEARIAPSGKGQVVGVVRDVTGPKRAHEALRESEAKYRQVFEHVHDVFFRTDMNGVITELSPSTEWWGYDPKGLIGSHVADFYADLQVRPTLRKALLEQGRIVDQHIRLKVPDGRVLDASASFHLLRGPDGAPIGIEGIARDVSERMRAERALRESEERLRTLIANAPVIMFGINAEGVFTVAEGTAMSLVGLRPEEHIGRSIFEVYRDVPGVIDAARRALAGERLATIVETGGMVFEAHVGPVRDVDGRIAGAVAVATDITARRQVEETLRIQRDLAIALSATADLQDALRLCLLTAIRASSLDSGCIYVADTSSGAFDLACHEGLRSEFVEKIARFEADSAYVRSAMTGKPLYTQYEQLAIQMDEPRRLEGVRALAAVPVQHQGDVIACLCVASHSLDNIPPASQAALETIAAPIRSAIVRSRASEALRESEERFRRLAEDSIDGILLVEESKVRFANAAFVAMLGYGSSEEIVGRLFTDFVSPDYRELMAERGRARTEGRDVPDRYEFRTLRRDGSEFDAEISVSTITYQGRWVRLGVIKDISERKRAEEALRESEERFRRLAEDSIDGIVLIEGSEVRFANTALVQMLGYESDEEVLVRPFTDFVSEDYRELMEERRRARNEGRDVPDRYELRPLRKDGSEFDAEISVSTITYRGGWARLGVIRDITERKRAEAALRESETKFRTLTETAAASVFIYRGTTPLYVNAATERLTGYTREEILARELWQFAHPDFQRLVRERSRARQGGEPAPSRYEFKIVTKSGKERWLDFTAGMIEFEGQPAAIGTGYDITERRQAEQALRDSEEHFRRLSEATLEGVFITQDARVLDANDQVAAMLGYKLPEIIGKDAFSFIAPESRDLVRQHVASGYEDPYEVLLLKTDGTTLPAEVCAKVAVYRGRPVRIGVMRDISERKRAEEAAQAAREELEARAEQRMGAAARYGLTFRELTVLYLIAAGMADKEIAFRLGISPRTASKHVENILSKMRAMSRTEAGVRAAKEGLVESLK